MEAPIEHEARTERIARRIRLWTRQQDPAGYRFAEGRYGWYRQDDLPFGVVTLADQLHADALSAALAECRCHFPTGPLTLWVDERVRDTRLRHALCNQGARPAFEARYMAHHGGAPSKPLPLPAGLSLVEGREPQLDDFVRVKQQAFMSTERLPSTDSLRAERARRLGELRHCGAFLLAYDGASAVAGVSFFRAGADYFLNLLVTRVPYRGRGIARALVDAVLARSYAEGAESVVVVPDPAVERLYHRAGFLDEVLWRQAYQLG